MLIKTANINLIKPFIRQLYLPKPNSHKGENGCLLIIGGSSLFHAASLWAAEIGSYFVDIVHYFSTLENKKIFINLKSKFRNGIIVSRKDLLDYLEEDDVILIGPGMLRRAKIKNKQLKPKNTFKKILTIKNEGEYTYQLTQFLIKNFPQKRFVFDAGSLQMMESVWLLKLKERPIITPHQQEFEKLFNLSIKEKSIEEKIKIVENTARKYQAVILLKAIVDIISDGKTTYIVEGGNVGLTKGGTGDILAGLTAAFYTKNNPLLSSLLSSYLLKRTADRLFETQGYWYNIDNIIQLLPQILKETIDAL